MASPIYFLENVQVSAVDDYVSQIINAERGLGLLGLHLHWSGAPTGTFALYQSNLPQPGRNPGIGWVPVPTAEVDFTGKNPAGSPGGSFVNLSNVSGAKYLVVYSHTAGSGSMDGLYALK